MTIVWTSVLIGVGIGIVGVAGLIFAMAIISNSKYPDPIDEDEEY